MTVFIIERRLIKEREKLLMTVPDSDNSCTSNLANTDHPGSLSFPRKISTLNYILHVIIVCHKTVFSKSMSLAVSLQKNAWRRTLGLVVQSWISANPGLKLNLLFQFGYICTPGFFRQLWKIKLLLNQRRILGNYLHFSKQAVGNIALEFSITYD